MREKQAETSPELGLVLGAKPLLRVSMSSDHPIKHMGTPAPQNSAVYHHWGQPGFLGAPRSGTENHSNFPSWLRENLKDIFYNFYCFLNNLVKSFGNWLKLNLWQQTAPQTTAQRSHTFCFSLSCLFCMSHSLHLLFLLSFLFLHHTNTLPTNLHTPSIAIFILSLPTWSPGNTKQRNESSRGGGCWKGKRAQDKPMIVVMASKY